MDHRLSIPSSSYRHFSSLARRLGRIFAHAYFHHREAFEQAEAESSLYARFLALTSKFDLVPPEFLVIPPSNADGTGSQQEVEPPRLLGAAVDLRRGQVQAEGKEDPDFKHDFVELSLEPNDEGDLLRSPAGPDGQRRRNRTGTMIFSEAVNIAEDLAKAQTEGELEAPIPFTEVPLVEEVTEVPLISEIISPTDYSSPAATLSSEDPEDSTDHSPTDEVEEMPLPAVTDSELAILEDLEEESDEEVVPEEEILDPTVTEPSAPPEPPSTIAIEPPPPDNSLEEKLDSTDVPEPVQMTSEDSEPLAEVAIPPATDEDEDDEEDEEPRSDLGPPEPEAKGDDDDEDSPQPANQPEGESE